MIAAVRARFSPFLLAHSDMQLVVDALQRAIPVPQREVKVRRLLGGKSFGKARHCSRSSFSTLRIFTFRGRPPCSAGGIIGSTNAHFDVRKVARITKIVPLG